METIKLTRQQLYDLVWKESLSSLSKKYVITFDGLKKFCKNNDIPVPQKDYWSKLKFNKPYNRIKLPELSNEKSIDLIIREKDAIISSNKSSLDDLTKQIENDKKAPLLVPDKLTKPDILIIQTNEYLKNVENRNWAKIKREDRLTINVDYDTRDRALRFMDTFIKLLKYRGHTFKSGKNNWGQICIINEVEFLFHLREVRKRIPAKKQFESPTYLFTGIYVLKIEIRRDSKEWKDGSLKLEQQLAKIVAHMEFATQKELDWLEKSRIERIKIQQEEKIKEDLLRRKQIELTNFRTLLSHSERFDKAIKLRNYINRLEEKAINNDSITEEFSSWLKWAKDKTDWYDPITMKKDDLLEDTDIDEIENPKQKNNYYR